MSGNALPKPLKINEQSRSRDDEMAMRRAAVLVTAGLPDDPEDALRVLDLARNLVTDFLKA